jgi:anti-sigma regulatory factor (Ser/Thr protein kinase)/CheY-like chemotaxis protein
VAQLDTEYRALCLAEERRWECQVESAVVESDPAQLERLLRNLLDNAIKHGGKGAVRLAVARDGGHVLIAVSDTGPGIAPAERERVFEEFYRAGSAARTSGLGLGLSIVKRLAQKLDCELRLSYADEERATGTCVSVRVPAGELSSSLALVADAPVDLGGLAVLIVDDDPAVLKATELLLTGWGCRVAASPDARGVEGALRSLGEPDVALIDYQLQDGVLGIDVVAGVQQRFPAMSTLIVTGESDPGKITMLKDLGFLLNKPVQPQVLRSALASIRSAGL